jgi:pyruvate/2-oxoacid:ferredoxin oxidoreductase alpha subunit
VEQNYQGQLGMLIRMECGLDITDKILKYDGRPFFYDELLGLLLAQVDNTKVAPVDSSQAHFLGFEAERARL